MEETMLIWGLALLAASVLLVVLEIFVPTGGVLAVTAILTAAAAVICLFAHDVTWGLMGMLFVLIVGPMVGFFGIQLWTQTKIGRAVIGGLSAEEEEARRRQEEERRRERDGLVGKTGEAMTDLRPMGVVKVNGKRYDAFAEIRVISAGTKIRVTNADGMDIRVRPADETKA